MSFQEKRLSYPSYAGASVTAEIMSVHFQSRRERRKEREGGRGEKGGERERKHSRDNGRGGVVGTRWGWAEDEGGGFRTGARILVDL